MYCVINNNLIDRYKFVSSPPLLVEVSVANDTQSNESSQYTDFDSSYRKVYQNDKVSVIMIRSVDNKVNNIKLLDNLCEIVGDRSNILVVCSTPDNVKELRKKYTVINIPLCADPYPYIDLAVKHLNKSVSLLFGYNEGNAKCNAGVLPIISHMGEQYIVLGVDCWKRGCSDFGGTFDTVYRLYKGIESHKNTMLGNRQIRNGMIDIDMIRDYCVTNQCDPDEIYQNGMGNGDLNSKYTAFREFIEETGYILGSNNKSIVEQQVEQPIDQRVEQPIEQPIDQAIYETIFDIEKVFEKLYKNYQYLYFGGDSSYSYDTYLMMFTVDCCSPLFKIQLFEQIDMYKADPLKYMKLMEDGTTVWDPAVKLKGNSEMKGIIIIPINEIINRVNKIDYTEYKSCEKSINRFPEKAMFDQESGGKGGEYNYHEKKYGVKFFDLMRQAFVDALIRYKHELITIAENPVLFDGILT